MPRETKSFRSIEEFRHAYLPDRAHAEEEAEVQEVTREPVEWPVLVTLLRENFEAELSRKE